MASPPIAAAAAELTRTDPAIRARVQRLVNRMLDKAEEMVETAPPPTQINLIKSVLPAVMRELKEEEKDDEIEKLRGLVSELALEVRDSIAKPPPEPEPEAVIPTDMP